MPSSLTGGSEGAQRLATRVVGQGWRTWNHSGDTTTILETAKSRDNGVKRPGLSSPPPSYPYTASLAGATQKLVARESGRGGFRGRVENGSEHVNRQMTNIRNSQEISSPTYLTGYW